MVLKMGEIDDKFFNSLLREAAPPSVMMITSPDLVRRRDAVKRYERHFTSEDAKLVIRGRDASSSQLRTELISQSILDSLSSLIVLKDYHEIQSSVLADLCKFLTKQKGDHTPILLEGDTLGASSPLHSLIDEGAFHLNYQPLIGVALESWIKHTCHEAGLASIEKEAISTLMQLDGGSLDSISHALELCALNLEPGATVTSALCSNLINVPSTAKEFALIDALAEKDRVKAELIISSLLSSGVSPFPLIGLLTKAYGNYLAISTMRKRGIGDAAIQSTLSLQPWLFKKQLGIASRMSPTYLRAAQRAILRADSLLKNRSLGPDLVLSELIAKLT
jgi:DNA polymerase III delta subunit